MFPEIVLHLRSKQNQILSVQVKNKEKEKEKKRTLNLEGFFDWWNRFPSDWNLFVSENTNRIVETIFSAFLLSLQNFASASILSSCFSKNNFDRQESAWRFAVSENLFIRNILLDSTPFCPEINATDFPVLWNVT